jgi:hypothetical protein
MASELITMTRGRRSVVINDKDLEHLVKLVEGDVRYLLGRAGKKRPGGDANLTKLTKRRELVGKLNKLRGR